MNSIEIIADTQKSQWVADCPYATLFFISCSEKIPFNELVEQVINQTSMNLDAARTKTASIVQALRRNGHIFESQSNVFSVFPPYAIKRDDDEWHIFGDAKIDIILEEQAQIFQVIYPEQKQSPETFHRSVLLEESERESIFNRLGLRAFEYSDLINLFQDPDTLVTPQLWPGYEPSPCDYWETFKDGTWQQVDSMTDIGEGLCRGINVNQIGHPIIANYFIRHDDGWSPLTTDEARLWRFRIRKETGNPYSAQYSIQNKTLQLPLEIPSSSYLALRYLAKATRVVNNILFVIDIERDLVKTICDRMHIKLTEEK